MVVPGWIFQMAKGLSNSLHFRYYLSRHLSGKSNVYSSGVIFMELIPLPKNDIHWKFCLELWMKETSAPYNRIKPNNGGQRWNMDDNLYCRWNYGRAFGKQHGGNVDSCERGRWRTLRYSWESI
ncbi:hypothetical protein MKW98_005628 [Papaver atlanticum]|uniref:Uncharacterized protein n=1 Tax=Papaver atlanticum TaxID=357466 RepID=A0AAD4STX3_9MAGN|nr:hypothetical protein MKW98_005628 [Papaver atlanticum]